LKKKLDGFSSSLDISNSAQPPYNVDTQSVKTFSWDSYTEFGVTDFNSRSLGSAVLTSGDQGLGAVPLMIVCNSPITKSMSELEDFPCVCGDEYGSESQQVWKLTGLDHTIGNNRQNDMAQKTCHSRMREADWVRTRGPQFIVNMSRINNHLTYSQQMRSEVMGFFKFCRRVIETVDLILHFKEIAQVEQRATMCGIWLNGGHGLVPKHIEQAIHGCICSTNTFWPNSCKKVRPEGWPDSGYVP
jgi:hypothetical protein